MRRTVVLLSIAACLTACGGSAPAPADPGTGSAPGSAGEHATAPALPAGLLLVAKPQAALDVFEAKQAAKEGETIVIRGKIGGSTDPFVDGRAVFTLADPTKIIECSLREGDTCTTPEDY